MWGFGRLSKELIPPTGKYPEDTQAFQTITRGIEIALEYEEVKKRVGDLYEKLQEAKKRFYALDEGYSAGKQFD